MFRRSALADTIEKRVSDLEGMLGDIPRIVNYRFDLVRDQLAAQGARLAAVEGKIDALPRVLAGMLTEMLDERERRKS
jgi:hypothetical protein